jgi:N-acyl-phosphatidylethanolamine-hydrolysing phospholipase D
MSIRLTFLGHSTVLIQDGPLAVLTDPVFSGRVLTARRRIPFPMNIGDLPKPTALVISHAHYDHLDLPTLKYIDSSVPIVLPTGLGKLVSKFVANPILEIPHGASHQVAAGLKITAFPVSHWGFRLSGVTYRGTNGYWIELNGAKIFFPGDTAYRDDFAAFRKPDAALLPIGPCAPSWLMRRRHMTPADAVRVLEETEAKKMIPIHWGTFKLGLDQPEAPMTSLKDIIRERNLEHRVAVMNPGEFLEIEGGATR